jgi:hypothetical protein
MRLLRSKLALALALSIGVLLGLGTYTFNYAAALSYLSNNPKTDISSVKCVTCHMNVGHGPVK